MMSDPINERLQTVGALAQRLEGMKNQEAREVTRKAIDLLIASVEPIIRPNDITIPLMNLNLALYNEETRD
jgi:hypothetical protein